MSGHSKWANIRVRKGAQDARRGKIFTRHARLIEISAREGGGGDPETNARLRTAIDNAKAEGVPNTNIERAVKKGTGALKGAAQMEAVMYEAYGPKGSAFLIECLTENKNRTLGSVRTILGRNGGRMAESGSVAWMFEQKGVVVARQSSDVPGAGITHDDLELALMDAGAEDIEEHEGTFVVTSGRESFGKIRDLFKSNYFEIETAGLKFIPKQTVPMEDEQTSAAVIRLMETLEEDEDVSEVHTNANISPH